MSANIQNESRTVTRERRGRERVRKASRVKYTSHVSQTNDSAITYVFAKSRLDETSERRAAFGTANPDEAQARASKWAWSAVVVVALVAVAVIDYLIIGGTLDYLLGMQRELQGLEEYYVYLKMLGTVALLAVEVGIAVGLVLLREYSTSRFSVFLHWAIGICLALALTGFAFGLIYTKIRNESVNINVAAPGEMELDGALISAADAPDSEIPTQKCVLLAGLCAVCFSVHIFALMKADSVADAFALAAYSGRQALFSGKETVQRFLVNRAAARTENSYRQAYDQFEAHNAEFPDDQLPSVPSQQDPTQRIPVMRLSSVAQRIIENLQNGAVENLAAARGEGADRADQAAQTAEHGDDFENGDGQSPPPVDGTVNDGSHSPHHDGDGTLGGAPNDAAAAGIAPESNHTQAGDRNGHNADTAEADYLRTILEAQVRNSEGDL